MGVALMYARWRLFSYSFSCYANGNANGVHVLLRLFQKEFNDDDTTRNENSPEDLNESDQNYQTERQKKFVSKCNDCNTTNITANQRNKNNRFQSLKDEMNVYQTYLKIN